METIPTRLVKTSESTNHSKARLRAWSLRRAWLWGDPLLSPNKRMLRIDLTESVSTGPCGQKVLEGVLTCSPSSYVEGLGFVRNTRAGFH